jgi:hypothetical protein
MRFGKGRHKAALNFGDCMSYALAKREDLPLLFKGTDFGDHKDRSGTRWSEECRGYSLHFVTQEYI